jgi:hypothetical protein
VTSRTNYFVIREKAGNVFYMRLVDSAGSPKLPRVESSHSLANDPANDVDQVERDVPELLDDEVAIEVFGVDQPGPEITDQLFHLISSELAAVTLASLSELLVRNPYFKLTSSDIAFIRGSSEFPNKTLTFSLPGFIEERFFALLRQVRLSRTDVVTFLVADSS